MKQYEVIDHTADIGLRAWGKDLKELFANAAYGCFELLADLKNVQTRKTVKIKLEAPNIEELFLSWLSELLYQFNTQKIIFKEFLIKQLSETTISAEAKGEAWDLTHHPLKREIKAVTYHQLNVRKVNDIWQGEVIFDV